MDVKQLDCVIEGYQKQRVPETICQHEKEIPGCYISFAQKMAKHGYGGKGKEIGVMLLSFIKK